MCIIYIYLYIYSVYNIYIYIIVCIYIYIWTYVHPPFAHVLVLVTGQIIARNSRPAGTPMGLCLCIYQLGMNIQWFFGGSNHNQKDSKYGHHAYQPVSMKWSDISALISRQQKRCLKHGHQQLWCCWSQHGNGWSLVELDMTQKGSQFQSYPQFQVNNQYNIYIYTYTL